MSRNFLTGRQSQQFYNDELYKLHQVLEHILDEPTDKSKEPSAELTGSLWLDVDKNGGDLKYFSDNQWKLLFGDRFKLICEINSPTEPKNPLIGQLWIFKETLLYFDGTIFRPVKSLDIDYDFNQDVFEDFLISTPMLNSGNQVLVDNASTKDTNDPYVSKIRSKALLRDEHGYVYVNNLILSEKGLVSFNKITSSVDFLNYNGAIEDTTFYPEGNKVYSVSTKSYVGTIPFRTANGDLHVNRIIIANKYSIHYSEKEDTIFIDKYSSVADLPEKGGIAGYDVRYASLPTTIPKRGSEGEIKVEGIIIGGRSIIYYDSINDRLDIKEFNVNDIDYANISVADIRTTSAAFVTNGKIVKSQFLVPDALRDKFFLNGLHTTEYETVSNVCIQYPSDFISDITPSFVHVKANRLIGIDKKVFAIDKVFPVIPIPEHSTEYYGFKDGVGKLLVNPFKKTYGVYDSSIDFETRDTNKTEYFSYKDNNVSGIVLSIPAAEIYDFIVSLTYKFGEIKSRGYVDKIKKDTLVENSIAIGLSNMHPIVFIQGMMLNRREYDYNLDTGYVSFKMPSRNHVAVMLAPNIINGTITIYNDETQTSVIKLPSSLKDSRTGELKDILLSIHGVTMYNSKLITDYEYDSVQHCLRIPGLQLGMEYSIVPLFFDNENIYIKDTYVTADGKIPCTFQELSGEDIPILIVDGLYIARGESTRDTEGNIILFNAKPNQQVKILRNNNRSLIFDDYAEFTTIPTNRCDDSIVYLQNTLLGSSDMITSYDLPQGSNNQVIFSNKYNKWFKYIKDLGWTELALPEDIKMKFETLNNGYTKNDTSISIIKKTDYADCTIYAYRFANTVDKKLIFNTIDTKGDSTYDTLFSHAYAVNRNELSVYIDGIRQYDVTETGRQKFKVNTPEGSQKITYILEECEGTEEVACYREVLTKENVLKHTDNTYKTKINLFSPNIKVFIGGLRQPKQSYKIINSDTIMFKSPLIGSPLNYPVEEITVNQNHKKITRNHSSEILIEARGDYMLNETIIIIDPSDEDANRVSFGIEDGLEKSMFETDDKILIYINGLLYIDGYKLDKNNLKLSLDNVNYDQILGPNIVTKYFNNNTVAYEKWKEQTGNKKYIQPNNTIIFEWR